MMVTRLFVRNRDNGQAMGLELEFDEADAPVHGDKREIDGLVWTCMDPDRGRPVAPLSSVTRPTIARSMPRKGDPRDPGAPQYDQRGNAVLTTTEEKLTYAKQYEQKNHEPCRFERTSSQGAFGDD